MKEISLTFDFEIAGYYSNTFGGRGEDISGVAAVLRMLKVFVLCGFINTPLVSYKQNFKHIGGVLKVLWYLLFLHKFHDFKL